MKTVIFDFDGTLADSLDVITEIFEQLTGQRVHELSKREAAELRHMPLLQVAERLHVPKWRVPFLMFHGRQLFARRLAQVKPFAGTQAALQELYADGYALF
ncbi:MAG TPA: HAD hydrolase-like protein, partial [Patescibacteria group bacterium]|nr:HAD hydrolase-like protein [Patescibacteria group bacterium]